MTERLLPTPNFHRVVKHSGLAFIAGIVADDESLDMTGQMQSVLNKLETYLIEAGSDRSKVLSTTVFITDMKLKPQMDAIWQEWFAASDLPARATVGVSDLVGTVLVELAATAFY
jgi:enamine deaminase RidA (YjgF/YER057c/UK114 family)